MFFFFFDSIVTHTHTHTHTHRYLRESREKSHELVNAVSLFVNTLSGGQPTSTSRRLVSWYLNNDGSFDEKLWVKSQTEEIQKNHLKEKEDFDKILKTYTTSLRSVSEELRASLCERLLKLRLKMLRTFVFFITHTLSLRKSHSNINNRYESYAESG